MSKKRDEALKQIVELLIAHPDIGIEDITEEYYSQKPQKEYRVKQNITSYIIFNVVESGPDEAREHVVDLIKKRRDAFNYRILRNAELGSVEVVEL